MQKGPLAVCMLWHWKLFLLCHFSIPASILASVTGEVTGKNYTVCLNSWVHVSVTSNTFSSLQVPQSQCYIFDPLFSELEIEVLNELGVTVVLENEVRWIKAGIFKM